MSSKALTIGGNDSKFLTQILYGRDVHAWLSNVKEDIWSLQRIRYLWRLSVIYQMPPSPTIAVYHV